MLILGVSNKKIKVHWIYTIQNLFCQVLLLSILLNTKAFKMWIEHSRCLKLRWGREGEPMYLKGQLVMKSGKFSRSKNEM